MSIEKRDVKSRGHFLVLELRYRSQANSRQLSGEPKAKAALEDRTARVFSATAVGHFI
jgi:hypothetical protein